MRKQTKKKKKKTRKKAQGLFCSRTCKARNAFGGLKCHVSGKGCGFVKIYINALDSNLFKGQIWDKIPQNPCLGVNFASWLKLFRGVFQNLCSPMCTPPYLSAPYKTKFAIVAISSTRDLAYCIIDKNRMATQNSPNGSHRSRSCGSNTWKGYAFWWPFWIFHVGYVSVNNLLLICHHQDHLV